MEKQQDRKRESNFSLFFLDPPPLSPPPLPLRCLNVSFGSANGKGLLKYGRMKNENRKNPKSQGLFRYFSLSLSLSHFFSAVNQREGGGVWKEGGTGEGNTSYYATLGSDPFEIPEAIKIEMGNSALPISA